jgi:hypothetical protein
LEYGVIILPLFIEADDVAAVLAIQPVLQPEILNVFRQNLLKSWKVLARNILQTLRGNGQADEDP